MPIPRIPLNGVEHELGLPVPHLFKDPKRLWLLTYTLSPDAVDELNFLHQRGTDVRVLAGKLVSDYPAAHFILKVDPSCHAKVWVVDDRVYVGSTNLSGDTIFNVMVEVSTTNQQSRRVITLVERALKGRVPSHTIVV